MVGADGRKFLKISPSRLPKTGILEGLIFKNLVLLDCLKLAFFKAFNLNLTEPVNFPFALKKIWSGPRGPGGPRCFD